MMIRRKKFGRLGGFVDFGRRDNPARIYCFLTPPRWEEHGFIFECASRLHGDNGDVFEPITGGWSHNRSFRSRFGLRTWFCGLDIYVQFRDKFCFRLILDRDRWAFTANNKHYVSKLHPYFALAQS